MMPLAVVVTYLKDLQTAGLIADIRTRSGGYRP